MITEKMSEKEKAAYALGAKLASKAMARYFYDALMDAFEDYRREDRDSIRIDDAKMEVVLALGRAFTPARKAEDS